MKKRFLLLILVLLFLLSGCMPSFLELVDGFRPVSDLGTGITEPSTPTHSQPSKNSGAQKEPEPSNDPPVSEPEPIIVEPVKPEFQDSWAEVLAGRTITAKSWFIYDCQEKSFVAISGDPEASVFPASVTKLFAAYVALHYIAPETVLTAGSELALVPYDASVAELRQGDRLTVEQLIGGMMLPSGNDATFVLATAVGRILTGDPELSPEAAIARFVEQMNYHAAMVGMTDSHFVTPDGWHDDNHYTSLDDLVKIGMLSWTNPVIAQSCLNVQQTIPMDAERNLEWNNSNILLNPEWDVYCPYAVGLKTGFTTPAGNCLLSAFEVGDRQILIGVFGCPVSYDRYAESLLLFCKAFDLEIPELPPETEPAE